jgi:hypothetical protein
VLPLGASEYARSDQVMNGAAAAISIGVPLGLFQAVSDPSGSILRLRSVASASEMPPP